MGMNIQNGPNTYPDQNQSGPQMASGPQMSGNPSDGLTSPDYRENQAIPPQQPYGPPQGSMDLVPNMSLSQWLLVKLMLWVPILNLVMLVIWAVGNPGKGKESLVNFSRASLIWMGIEFVISIILWVVFFVWLSAVIAGAGTAYYY